MIDITADKIWVGGPVTKPTIEFQLLRDGKEFGEAVILKDKTLEYTWKDLEATDLNGKEYIYTVKEVEVPDEYDMTISDDGLTITNTHESVDAANRPETPGTGINNNQFLLRSVIVASGLLLVGLLRKKKNKRI